MSKLIKSYTLNMRSLLYDNYTAIKILNNKRIKKLKNNKRIFLTVLSIFK